MAEFISESYLNLLKQYVQQKPAREPAINRGYRLRNIKGGKINQRGRLAKQSHLKRHEVAGDGPVPRGDNTPSTPRNPKDSIGRAVGEDAINLRFALVAANNFSAIRDFAGVGPDLNADILASKGAANPTYASGGVSIKPSIYNISIDATGARAPAPTTHPNLILYAAYGLTDFNPAYPIMITGNARNFIPRVVIPPGVPLPGCPGLLPEATNTQELVIFPTGWSAGVTDDVGFYYMVIHHNYAGGFALDVTCSVDVDFLILGYEG